jgi:hypothetical protein
VIVAVPGPIPVTVKFAEVSPARITTEAGTVATAEFEEESATIVSVPRAAERVTLPPPVPPERNAPGQLMERVAGEGSAETVFWMQSPFNWPFVSGSIDEDDRKNAQTSMVPLVPVTSAEKAIAPVAPEANDGVVHVTRGPCGVATGAAQVNAAGLLVTWMFVTPMLPLSAVNRKERVAFGDASGPSFSNDARYEETAPVVTAAGVEDVRSTARSATGCATVIVAFEKLLFTLASPGRTATLPSTSMLPLVPVMTAERTIVPS